MIEKNTVIIDLVDYDGLKKELYDCKNRLEVVEVTSSELMIENRKLKVEILTDWLKINFVEVKNNGNDFDWEYKYQKNDYYALATSYNASLEVAEIALNDYIESQKGEEE